MNSPLYYELLKPENVKLNEKYPALFIMHGMGSNEKDLLPLVTGFEEKMFIFSIRGPIFQPPGYAFFSFQQLGQPDRSTFDETVQKINTFFTYAEENYPIDPQQIYLMGFSQGAIMSMAIGIQSIDKIKGIIALSGYIPSFIKEEYKEQALSKMNIFVSHGFGDEVLPYHWAKESVEFLKQSGANVVFKTYQAGHWVSQENYVDLRAWLNDSLN